MSITQKNVSIGIFVAIWRVKGQFNKSNETTFGDSHLLRCYAGLNGK